MKPYHRQAPHASEAAVAVEDEDSTLDSRPRGTHAVQLEASASRGIKGRIIDFIGAHPGKSLLIAAGIGALLGFGLTRRK
jgi:ElaB/YqjD/DUF883 family membrane-anchored ribosome-binding protein